MDEIFYDARDIAVDALRDRGGNVSAHLERVLGASGLSGADRGFASELSLGTLRRRLTWLTILRAFLEQPDLVCAGGRCLTLCRWRCTSFFSWIACRRLAAVNEAVEQATRLQSPSSSAEPAGERRAADGAAERRRAGRGLCRR